MNKLLVLSLLMLLANNIQLHAQTPFPTIDSVNINNLSAAVLVHGDMWWEGGGPGYEPKCGFSVGSKKSVGFASALWLSGYDDGGQLHVAAQTYRQDGNDYWPGPLDNSGNLSYRISYEWAKIWKVNRTDIQYFQLLGKHTKSNTPDCILTWPAKGNANAQGNAGTKLNVTKEMAPFIDLNNNDIYEPLLGDYPDIKGDQALWWVFNDNGASHSQSNGKPIGVEVHAMSYAYKRGTLIDNVIYYEYKIVNRSANGYSNFRAGLATHMQIGYPYDDYIGFDSAHRMGIQYNGTMDDGGSAGSGGYPAPSPVVGVSFISLPGDDGYKYVPAGSYTYYNSDRSIIGIPATDTEYSNYMRSKLRNGQPFTNDFAGAGVNSKGYSSGGMSNYVFTGDPGDKSQWSECSSNNNPGGKQFTLSSNDFALAPGSTQKVVMALIAVDSIGGCPRVDFSKIKIAADTAWAVYRNTPAPKPVAAINVAAMSEIKIFPNPVNDRLYIAHPSNENGEVHIVIQNTLGQDMQLFIDYRDDVKAVDVSRLPAGFYTVTYRNAQSQTMMKFVKQ